ncbi:MAG TPA: isochorismatase family cysteine hydrolase [Coriobacteriia bacterium]|nr:isochorismatase family cysteine hydrolase [Coriobacteriia bacterium]
MSDGRATSSSSAALLVVDVQQALFEHQIPVYRGDELLDTIEGLVDRAHESGALVVFVQHCNKAMAHGSSGWSLHSRLKPTDTDLIVEKTHGDAFEGTNLDGALRSRSVSTVFVTGLVTHGCVRATCVGGQTREYDVVLVADGHSSYNRKAAELIEEWNATLSSQLAAVLPAEQVDFFCHGEPALS